MRLAGKSIVVTGATGIAAATAQLAAREGASLFVISMVEDECRELVSEIEGSGGRASWSATDLTDEEAAVAAFAASDAYLDGIDGLIAVAGASGRPHGDGPLHEMGLDAWEKTFEINAGPAFLSAREAVRRMRGRGGSVVLVGSILATHPVPALFPTHAYAAAKGAVASLTTALAAYYAAEQIRVNGIAPGLVRTSMAERAAADEETVAYSVRKQPLAAGFLQPQDVAPTAVFLLSDESSQITGQVIAVDGGWSVTEG
jgi:NAD(P)-dependent dehydrogenase (short-subunit alcohol dehydrogenase family)